jgi:periplasmic divalent cation tolerance protein
LEKYVQLITTTGKKEDAEKIAKDLVEKRLAGCVQIIPISSTYWWNDKIIVDEEWLCFIKSKKNLFDKLERAIKEVHPYTTPEIIAIPITAGSKTYLDWLDKEVSTE